MFIQSFWLDGKGFFLVWTINFINFLDEYKKSLDKSIRNKHMLLQISNSHPIIKNKLN